MSHPSHMRSPAICLSLSVLLFILFAGTFVVAAAPPESERDQAELKGPVKMVVAEFQTLKSYDSGTPDPYRSPAGTDIYDRAGNLVERKNFTPDFIDDQHREHLNPETVLIHSNMGDKRQLMKFDSTGKLIRFQLFVGLDGKGLMLDDTRSKYDVHGREIEQDLFDPDGSSSGVVIITRDPAGNIVEREYRLVHDGPFPLILYYKYEFDSRGNWIKQIQSGNDPDHNQKSIAPVGILYRTITYFDTNPAPAMTPSK